MNRQQVRTLVVSVLSGLLVFTACGSEPVTVNAGELIQRADGRLWKLSEKETRRCVLRTGFSYLSPLKRPGPVPAFDFPDYESQVKAVGSGLTQNAINGLTGAIQKRLATQNADPNLEYEQTLNNVERAKYRLLVNDCKNSAATTTGKLQQELVGALGDYSKSLQNTAAQQEELRLTAKFQPTWASCMTAQGYRVTDVNQPIELIQRKISAAGNDLKLLESEVLPYDIAISSSSWECDVEWRKQRSAIQVAEQTSQATDDAIRRIEALDKRIQKLLASVD